VRAAKAAKGADPGSAKFAGLAASAVAAAQRELEPLDLISLEVMT